MSDTATADGLIKSLKSLVTFEYVVLLLSFTSAANIALVNGLHQTIQGTSWEALQKSVSLMELLLFFCCFGFVMTGGAYLLGRLWHELSSPLISLCYKFPILGDNSRSLKSPDYSIWIPSSDVQKKSNRDSDSYYGAIYKHHSEGLRNFRRLVSDATACLGLIVADLAIDRGNSITVFAYKALVSVMPGLIAVIILLYIAYLLVSIIWDPYKLEDDLIHCPGFPEEDNSILRKRREIESQQNLTTYP